MDYAPPPCFNTYNNISYRQRSQTLQPIRGSAMTELANSQYMINKYFTSQIASHTQVESERANYANVPPSHHHHHTPPPHPHQQQEHEILLMQHHHPSPRQHPQHVHVRSQSQHYYNTTCQQVNDLNNYYNLSNIGTVTPARSRLPSPINVQPLPSVHNHVQPLDPITIMQVCNELGHLDSPPPMPNPRNYTISGSGESGLYKIAFPQRRFIKSQFTDPATGIPFAPGTSFSILGPSKGDRSKFSVCYSDQHMDMPHQLTQAPQPTTQWN